MDILKMIPTGKHNKISTAELKNLTGFSQRKICQHIENLRKNGTVILSCSSGGYWLPDLNNPEEATNDLEKFISYMQSKDTYNTTKGAKNMLLQLKERVQVSLYEHEEK